MNQDTGKIGTGTRVDERKSKQNVIFENMNVNERKKMEM